MKITKKQLQEIVRSSLQEYVVPMGYSLKQWKKKKKKEKISNKDYAEKTKGDKWKVVHGKSKGKVGKPINKSATNLSYGKAMKMHTAIELNESLMKDINNPKRKQVLGKFLFTEYGYAIFQPFLAPILTSVFGPYIPPVDIPSHHRAETDISVEERIESLPKSMPPELRKFSLFPEEDLEVTFKIDKSNYNPTFDDY